MVLQLEHHQEKHWVHDNHDGRMNIGLQAGHEAQRYETVAYGEWKENYIVTFARSSRP